MRKAALASALTLLLNLSTTPTLLTNPSRDTAVPGADTGAMPVATDWIFPVGNPRIAPTFDQGNGNGYQITQMFNNSCDPSLGQGYYYAGQYFCGHTGVDLSNHSEGGTIVAAANGVVVFAGYNTSYGEMVRIQHLMPDGTYMYSQYEHLEYGQVFVWYGEVVSLGQAIGLVGSTGFVTGPHLHFEIKNVNEDGVGYTFGNQALIAGYFDPIAFVAAHALHLEPTATPTQPPTATATAPAPLTPTVSSTPAISVTAPTTTTASGGVTETAAPRTEGSTASNGGEHQAVLADFYSRYHDYVTVTAVHLNVRTGSGYDYAPINSVNKGARLGYLGMTGNGWVHVALPSNVYGYVVRQWVEGAVLPPLPSTDWGSLKPPFATVLDDLYPARSAPRMRAVALEPLWKGEKVAYLGTLGSWDKVVLPSGHIGWVLGWYLRAPDVRHDLTPVREAPARTPIVAPAVNNAAPRAASRGGLGPKVASLDHDGATDHDRAGSVASSRRQARSRPAVAGPYVVTTADGLRLRDGPRLGAGIVEVLPAGTRLGLRGYHTSWVAVVAPDGAQGYVLGRYVATVGAVSGAAIGAANASAPAAGRTATPSRAQSRARSASTAQRPVAGYEAPYVAVTVQGANLRAGPSREDTVLASEPYNAVLALRGTQGQWAYVETRTGLSGWMRRDLIRAVS